MSRFHPLKRLYLAEHIRSIAGQMPVGLGDIERNATISFDYDGILRFVYVLHPNMHGYLHGMDLRYLPRDYLMPMEPVAQKLDAQAMYLHHLKTEEIEQFDAYRTYKIEKIEDPMLLNYRNPKP